MNKKGPCTQVRGLEHNPFPSASPGQGRLSSHAIFLLMALCALALGLGGCGYGFSEGQGTIMGENIKTLKIRGIDQPTTYAWLGQVLRSNLRDEIGARKVAIWVDSGDSDYTIEIKVEYFTIRSTMHDSQDNIMLFSAHMVLYGVIYRASDNTEVWRSNRISYSDTYETYFEQQAGEQLALQIIRILVNEMRNTF